MRLHGITKKRTKAIGGCAQSEEKLNDDEGHA
jgi:hypothetical protein